MKKIIITGANGNLGKAVIKKITDNGSYVIAIVENEAMKNDIDIIETRSSQTIVVKELK